MAHSLASDSMASGKLPPTLTPTGHFAGKPTLPISRSVTLIGSRKQARLQLISSTVSQSHALIVNADSGPYIRDLASRMGIQVNGQQARELPLNDGDEVQIGRFTFRFNASPQAQSAPNKNAAPAAAGRIQVEGVEYAVPIDGHSLLIGRRDTCDIHLLEDTASTTHAIIFEMDGRRYIRDLASRTGTFVNGKQVHQVEILPGDELRVGDTTMRYLADGAPGVTQDEIIPADLGAAPEDLIEPELRPARPTAPAPANGSGESLEMVHDQAAELEEVELAPTELEAPIQPEAELELEPEAEAPIELDPIPARPRPQPKAPMGMRMEVPPVPLPRKAPPMAPAAPIAAAAPEVEFHVQDEPTDHRDVQVVHLEPVGNESSAPQVAADDLVELEPEPAVVQGRSVAPAPVEPIAPVEDDLELEPLAIEPGAEEPVAEEAAPIEIGQQPAVAEVEEIDEPVAIQPVAQEPEVEAAEPDEEVELAPLAIEPQAEEVEEEFEPAPVAPVKPLIAAKAIEPEPIEEPAEEPEAELGLAPAEAEVDALDLEPEPAPIPALKPAIKPAPEPVAEAPIAPPPASKPSAFPARGPVVRPAAKAPVDAPSIPKLVPTPVAPVIPIPIPIPTPAPIKPAAEIASPKPAPAKAAPAKPVAPPAPVKPEVKPAPAKPVVAAPPPPKAPPAPAKVAAPKPAPKLPEALPLEAFKAPDETIETPSFDVGVDDSLPELSFEEPAMPDFTAELGEIPQFEEPAPAKAPKAPAAKGKAKKSAAPAAPAPTDDLASIDFGDIPELPDSLFTADDTAFEVPALDLADAEESATIAEDAFAAEFDLGLETPEEAAAAPNVTSSGTMPPVVEDEVEEAVEEEPAAEALEIEEPVAEAPAPPPQKPVRRPPPRVPAEDVAPVAPVAKKPAPIAEPEPAEEISLAPEAEVADEEAEAETIAPAEATPESAQALDDALDDALDADTTAEASDEVGTIESVDLTDSGFGRAVTEFTGDSTGDILETDSVAEGREELLSEPPAASEEVVADSDDDVEAVAESSAEADAPITVDDLDEEDDEVIPPLPQRSSRWGPGASQLELEPIEPPAARPPVDSFAESLAPAETDAIDEIEVPLEPGEVELEPEAITPVEPEAVPEAAEETTEVEAVESIELEPEEVEPVAAKPDRLFDLEPIEAPVPAAEDEEVSLEPVEPAPASEAIVEAFESTQAAPPARPAPASPVAPNFDDLAEVELEPEAELEIEPAEVEAVEAEPALDDLLPPELSAEEMTPIDQPHATSSIAEDVLTDEIDLEPMEQVAPPTPQAPAAPAPVAKAPPTPQPAVQPPVPQPQQPPQQSQQRGGIDAFNWGANQEHFFGGMPLRLTPPTPSSPAAGTPVQAPPITPIAPAAAAAAAAAIPPADSMEPPLLDDLDIEIEPDAPVSAPPPVQKAPPAQAAPPKAPAAPAISRPVPRPTMAPRPQQTSTSAKAPKGSPVTTGFDGLAMPPVRETDVFSNTPGSLTAGFAPGLMDDVFSGSGRISGSEIPPTQAAAPVPPADSARPRRATKAEASGDAWAPTPAPTPAPASGPPRRAPAPSASGGNIPPVQPAPPPPPRKKRRWFGLKILILILMPVAMLVSAAGVLALVPVKSAVTASLKFNNFADVPKMKRVELVRDQLALISSDAIRSTAVSKVIAKGRDPGFLKDPLAFAQVVSEAKFDLDKTEGDKGVMSFTYAGSRIASGVPIIWPAASADADRPRLLALLQAIYDANLPRVTESQGLTRTIESLNAQIASTTGQIDKYKQQIEQLTADSEAPDLKQRADADAEAKRLEEAANAAMSAASKAAAELKMLRDNPSAPLPGAAAVALPAIPPPPPAPDDQLTQLQSELDQLNQKVGVAKEGQSDRAKIARAQLDAALESFNNQIAQAQAAMKDNPQLVAYLGDAQKLLQSTRELTDGLIKRQQDQYAQLSDLKARLNDKMLARRAEVWKKDPDLVKLMDQKDIRTRQYNAAVGQGLTKEAIDIKADLDLIDSSIRARQTIIADDGFYADAIDQIQKIIDATQRNLDEDRAKTLASIDEMQIAFTKSQPAALTPDQQKLADDMGKTLGLVSAARKQYTLAADSANKQADEEIRTLQVSAQQLAGKVEARKQQLAAEAGNAAATPAAPAGPVAPSAEERAKAIEQKTAELVAAEKARDEVQLALSAAQKKVVDLKERVETAKKAGQQRDVLIGKRDSLAQELTNVSNQLDEKKRQSQAAIFPAPPSESDVAFTGQPDLRPRYALIAVGIIAALGSCLLLLGSSGGSSNEPPAAADEEFEADPFETEELPAPEDEHAGHPNRNPETIEA